MPTPGLTRDGQAPAVPGGETLCDRETKAVALRAALVRVHPVERLEDPLEIRGGDPWTVVGDLDDERRGRPRVS